MEWLEKFWPVWNAKDYRFATDDMIRSPYLMPTWGDQIPQSPAAAAAVVESYGDALLCAPSFGWGKGCGGVDIEYLLPIHSLGVQSQTWHSWNWERQIVYSIIVKGRNRKQSRKMLTACIWWYSTLDIGMYVPTWAELKVIVGIYKVSPQ